MQNNETPSLTILSRVRYRHAYICMKLDYSYFYKDSIYQYAACIIIHSAASQRYTACIICIVIPMTQFRKLVVMYIRSFIKAFCESALFSNEYRYYQLGWVVHTNMEWVIIVTKSNTFQCIAYFSAFKYGVDIFHNLFSNDATSCWAAP